MFEANLATGELRKGGVKIKLQEQPFQLLSTLLERPGEVVTREELRERLWLEDTYVDFDRSLNTAASRLREALGDEASNPRFVETLPRRGYRFIAPVEGAPKPSTPPQRKSQRTTVWIAAVAAAALAVSLYFNRKGQAPAGRLTAVPLTSYSGREVHPVLSPDGKQVAFAWNGEREDNFDIYVKQIGVEGQLRLTTDPAEDLSPAWSPDGTRTAFLRRSSEGSLEVIAVSALGSPERKLGLVQVPLEWWVGVREESRALDWGPDGESLALSAWTPDGPGRISLLGVHTREMQPVTTPPAGHGGDLHPVFSPDGQTLAFVRSRDYFNRDVCLVRFSRPGATVGEPECPDLDHRMITGVDWSTDGRSIMFVSRGVGMRGLWRAPASGGDPERLEVGGDDATQLSVSRRGDRLVYADAMGVSNIWRIAGPLAPPGSAGMPVRLIHSSRGDGQPQFSRDGRRIVFWSTRTGKAEIWVANSDGSDQVPLTSMRPSSGGDPRWSPDGRHLAFDCVLAGNKDIYVVSADGGKPRRVTTHSAVDARPSWSSDGKWIYFGSHRSGDSQIWKKPVAGGEAMQVTRHGGREAFESWDGKFVYYAKTFGISGLWRAPAEGGEEVQVIDHGRQGYWALIDKGICLLNVDEEPTPFVEFYDFSTGELRTVKTLPEEAGQHWGFAGYMAVSPDGQWLLYQKSDHVSSDIMLVEDFR